MPQSFSVCFGPRHASGSFYEPVSLLPDMLFCYFALLLLRHRNFKHGFARFCDWESARVSYVVEHAGCCGSALDYGNGGTGLRSRTFGQRDCNGSVRVACCHADPSKRQSAKRERRAPVRRHNRAERQPILCVAQPSIPVHEVLEIPASASDEVEVAEIAVVFLFPHVKVPQIDVGKRQIKLSVCSSPVPEREPSNRVALASLLGVVIIMNHTSAFNLWLGCKQLGPPALARKVEAACPARSFPPSTRREVKWRAYAPTESPV